MVEGLLPITGDGDVRGLPAHRCSQHCSLFTPGVASCSSSVESRPQPQGLGVGKVRTRGLVLVVSGTPDPLASDPVRRSLLWSSQSILGRALVDWPKSCAITGSRGPALYFIPEASGHLCDLGEQVPGPPKGRG